MGLLPSFASVHGATLDGAVRHEDQVVAAALAAHGLPCIGAGWGPAPPGELADAMTLPRTFPETPWEELVVLGWRDPRASLRGYLVVERDGGPVGVAVRAADTRMSSATPAMCLLCRTAQSGSDVSLFTARRAGEAGRNGDTVGTYVCADLGCAVRARAEIPPWLRERDPEEVAAERTAELEQRVHGFLDAVLR